MMNRLLVKFNRPKHVSMVGEGHGSHVVFFGQIKDLFETNGSVQKAVLAMDMKVDKMAMFHVFYFLCYSDGIWPLISVLNPGDPNLFWIPNFDIRISLDDYSHSIVLGGFELIS
jgi:hypothetical protein